MAPRHLFPTAGGFRVVNGDDRDNRWTRGFALVTHGDGPDGADVHRFLLHSGYVFPGSRSGSLLARFAAYATNRPGPTDLPAWQDGARGLHTGCLEDSLGGVSDHTAWRADALLHAADDDRLYPLPAPFTYLHETVSEASFNAWRLSMFQVDPQWLVGVYEYGPGSLVGYVWGRRLSAHTAEEWWGIEDLSVFHRLNPCALSDERDARAIALQAIDRVPQAEALDAFERLSTQPRFAFFHVQVTRYRSRLPDPLT